MFFRLLLLFVSVPIIELFLLLEIGRIVGVPGTIAIVLGTGVLGASLARWQGLRTALRIQQELAAGEVPADALIDGLLIFVAGAVLLTPGVLTDAIGFALLTPSLRAIFKRQARLWFERTLRAKADRYPTDGYMPPNEPAGPSHDAIIGVKVIDAKASGTRVEDEE